MNPFFEIAKALLTERDRRLLPATPARPPAHGTEFTTPVRCGVTRKPFLYGFRYDARGFWNLERAETVPIAGGGMQDAPFDPPAFAFSLEGMQTPHGFPHCPHCGDNAGFVRCSCGSLYCKGAVRTQAGKIEYRCGACETWGRVSGTITELEGRARSSSPGLSGGQSRNRLGGGQCLLPPRR